MHEWHDRPPIHKPQVLHVPHSRPSAHMLQFHLLPCMQSIWGKLSGLKWMHSSSAGLEHLLFPELVNGPVVLTNARGVYSNSLAEFALMGMKYFAMDMPRILKAKAEKRWDPFEVEELRGKTLGVVGYGDIGQAGAGEVGNVI